MTYQVLARKWRPTTFENVIGQPHVTQALSNALKTNRLHHAYLFSGTRGVGKTTLARIFAACLNCDNGISANPCGKCEPCLAIAQGRFVDVFEIDAASRTRVEDTREILDNVQYRPAVGRFKIYLIDEVHMLSGHSFNALLKTLEEPPEHVKFLLATTDPQKLPVTVLSRCLQFNLKPVISELIAEHLAELLTKENITFEKTALELLAQNANGSVRDALSLLDQTIAYTDSNITYTATNELLGNVSNKLLFELLATLAKKDADRLIKLVDELMKQAANLNKVLANIITLLHDIALYQFSKADNLSVEMSTLAAEFSTEDVQLYYQIALTGLRDMPLAPTPRCGFEMTLLRMLAFELADDKKNTPSTPEKPITKVKASIEKEIKKPKPAVVAQSTDEWINLVNSLTITGMTATLASQCSLESMSDDNIKLIIAPEHAALHNLTQEKKLAMAITEHLGHSINLTITKNTHKNLTPAQWHLAQQESKKRQAIETIATDKQTKMLTEAFGLSIRPEWVKTND